MLVGSVADYVLNRLFLYQCIISLASYLILKIVLFMHVRKRRHGLLSEYGIPGPKPRLLDGSMTDYTDVAANYLTNLKFQKKYGKVFGIYVGDEPNVIVSDLELLRKIFIERESSFKRRLHVYMDLPLAKSLVYASYHRWKPMRKIMAQEFSTFNVRAEASTGFIEETFRLLLNYIEKKFEQLDSTLDGVKGGESRITLDFLSLMEATSLRLINGLAINLPDVQISENESSVASLNSHFSALGEGPVLLAIKFPFLHRILAFMAAHFEPRAIGCIRRVLNKKVNEGIRYLNSLKNAEFNIKPPEEPHLISTLIKNHHQGNLDRDEVIGNCEAMLLAGYGTTSTTLTYIFWVLGKYPEVQEKLRTDLMAHGTESKYLAQVINETMRLYPVNLIFTTRVATENVTIDNLTLPSGTKVVYDSWLMYRDPKLWPEPEKFDPERFREGVKYHPCAFAPFGFGSRKCIGSSLAMLEMKILICDMLYRYRVHLKSPDDLSLITYATIISRPSEKVILELSRI